VLYRGKRWQALRILIINRDKYTCQRCKVFVTKGKRSPRSAVVHHKIPHKGDDALFWDQGNLELVCKACHDGPIQSAEARGYDSTVGADGWPIDAKHPHNRPAGHQEDTVDVPQFKAPTVPVTIVCGAPGSGKTTYAASYADPFDTIIDLDDLKEFVGGTRWDADYTVTAKALRIRDTILNDLHRVEHSAVWLILSGRTDRERKAWAKALGGASVVVMPTPKRECIRRVKAEPERSRVVAEQIASIEKWFAVV
jgi:predicted kinase